MMTRKQTMILAGAAVIASAPGPRVSTAQAAAPGTQVPAGAQVSTAANTITFTTTAVRLTILASPAAAPGTYRYPCPVPGHAQKGMSGTFTAQLQVTHPMSPEPGPVQGT